MTTPRRPRRGKGTGEGEKAWEMERGTSVILFLHSPKEKIWGVLVSMLTAGVVLRGLDLATFDDWVRQEARGDERGIGPATLFYPMNRVERMERDETVGPILSCAARFEQEAGRSVLDELGIRPHALVGLEGRKRRSPRSRS